MSKNNEHKDDGSCYAQGEHLFVNPLKTRGGYSMAGPIAQCQNEKTARRLADIVNRYETLQAALKSDKPDGVAISNQDYFTTVAFRSEPDNREFCDAIRAIKEDKGQ